MTLWEEERNECLEGGGIRLHGGLALRFFSFLTQKGRGVSLGERQYEMLVQRGTDQFQFPSFFAHVKSEWSEKTSSTRKFRMYGLTTRGGKFRMYNIFRSIPIVQFRFRMTDLRKNDIFHFSDKILTVILSSNNIKNKEEIMRFIWWFQILKLTRKSRNTCQQTVSLSIKGTTESIQIVIFRLKFLPSPSRNELGEPKLSRTHAWRRLGCREKRGSETRAKGVGVHPNQPSRTTRHGPSTRQLLQEASSILALFRALECVTIGPRKHVLLSLILT